MKTADYKSISKKLKFDLNFVNYLNKKTLPDDLWIIHIRDITEIDFKKPDNFLEYTKT